MATELGSVRHPDLLAFRGEFDLVNSSTYLNTCSLGALSIRSRVALGRFLDQWNALGARAWYRHWLDELAALREDFGWTIGRPGSEIALAPNVSTALATFASALDPIHRGDPHALGRLREAGLPMEGRARTRVITTALDFPTVGHQWLARAPLGVEVVVLPSPDGLTVPVEAFEAAIDDRTALVATAHVYFTTGAVQDVAALATMAHERGALLLIDAYQATGLIPTDLGAGLPESQPDAYVSGTLKWLFGGPGNAFLWVRPELRDALRPTTTGWFSSAHQFAFDVARSSSHPTAASSSWAHPRCPAPSSPVAAWSWSARSALHARTSARSTWARWRSGRRTVPACASVQSATTHAAVGSSRSRWRTRSPSSTSSPGARSSWTTGPGSSGSRQRSTTPRARSPRRSPPSRRSCRPRTGSKPGTTRRASTSRQRAQDGCNTIRVSASLGVNTLTGGRVHARAIHLDQVDGRAPRAGDRPSAAEAATLFETFEARLRGYVAFRVREPADVDDLVGDVFRRVVAGPIPQDEATWPAWLFRVAHNVVVDHYRRRRFLDPLTFGFDRPDDAPGLPEQAIRGEQLRATDGALRRLPGRQRAAIYLRYYEDLDFSEIADVLNVPSSTARSLVHRGLKRVAAELQTDEER